MYNVDDIIFSDFVSNNLSHDEMIEVEKVLINEGDADSTLMASMAFYYTNQDLATELIGDEINDETHNDRNSDNDNSKVSKSKRQENMGNGKMFNFTSVATIGAAFSAHKLFDLYKNSKLEYLRNKNVASIEFANKDNMALNYNQAKTTYGQPSHDIEFDPEIFQYYHDTCAFQSQAIILREYGFDVTQDELAKTAKEQGWYVEGHGTPHNKLGKLLEYFGIDTTTSVGNNIFNLANELAQGHRILVKVDSGELWSPGLEEIIEDQLILEYSDHALLVVGLDTSNPNDVKVIVTDPGNGNTQYAYTEKEFMDAWKDSKCFMISTNKSPEEHLGNTEYEPPMTFGNIPYETITRLSDSDICIDDTDYFHDFFKELRNHPDKLDSLINEYPNLFERENDEWE